MRLVPMQSAIEARINTPAMVQDVAFIRTSEQMPLCGRTRASRGDKGAKGRNGRVKRVAGS